MFFNPATNTAFGSLGWVDRASLWCLDVGSGTERRVAVPGARYVTVHRHADDLVRLTHHGETVVASIRACANPELELASLHPCPTGWRFQGDSALWGEQLALLMISTSGRTELLLVDGPAETVRPLDLSWFNDENYDLGYQGLVDCLALPAAGVVVVSVQRGRAQAPDRWLHGTRSRACARAAAVSLPDLGHVLPDERLADGKAGEWRVLKRDRPC